MTVGEVGPVVTVGLPVKDGGELFHDAVADILAQTEPRLRLLISDNASTDNTAAAADAFAASDPRIEVVHQPNDVGPVANFNSLLEQVITPYFVWAAHDDRWEPDFLATCLALLEGNPDAVGALVGVQVIGEDGRPERRWRPPQALASQTAVERVRALPGTPWWYGFYGVYRVALLPPDLRYQPIWNGDGVFVFDALLHGPFAITDRVLRRYRIIDTAAKEVGEQRDIRVNRPKQMAAAMTEALGRAAVAPADAVRIARVIGRLRIRMERVTRAYRARRAAVAALARGDRRGAFLPGLTAFALAPIQTGRSLSRRLWRWTAG